MSALFKRIFLLSVVLAAASVYAEPEGTTYAIEWYTIDGGGGTSTGGNFSLSGTIGQFDAVPGGASGGNFGLYGGFWGGTPGSAMETLFEDGFENP